VLNSNSISYILITAYYFQASPVILDSVQTLTLPLFNYG